MGKLVRAVGFAVHETKRTNENQTTVNKALEQCLRHVSGRLPSLVVGFYYGKTDSLLSLSRLLRVVALAVSFVILIFIINMILAI